MFRMVLAQGRSLIQQSDEIERLAHARLAEHGDYQLLRKIPGIGPDHALPEIGVSPPPADTGASHHRDVEHPEPAAGSKLIRAVIRGNEGAASPAPAIRPASFAFAAG